MGKSKTNYTKKALTEFIRALAKLEGYENPTRFLDEKLNEVRRFKDFEFECDYFLNVHYLCKEFAHEFWSNGHRRSISKWLRKSKILTDVFSTTWEFWDESPYKLEPEKFYLRAKGQFINEGLYENEEAFVSNQLERLNLLIDKYKNALVNGTEVNISQNQFIRLKQYQEYFNKIEVSTKALPLQQTGTKTDKLKVPQIALIHVYEGIQITRENAGEIAAKHGYTAKNSGEGLFQDYTYYCSTANRKGKPTPCTPKRLRNKIKLFESVVSHLSDNHKQRANDEIAILKTLLENEYQ